MKDITLTRILMLIVFLLGFTQPASAAYISPSRISRICDTTSYNLKEQSAQFDYDGNGELGISDVIISLRVASGVYKSEQYSGKIFDLDGNGTITSSDARILLVCRDAFLSRIEQQQTQGGVQTTFRPSVEKAKDTAPPPSPVPPQQPQPPATVSQSTESIQVPVGPVLSNGVVYRISSGPCEGNEYPQVQGYDYNNDGFIDQYDHMIIEDISTGKRKASDFPQKMIDSNKDGKVNERDIELFKGCGVSSVPEIRIPEPTPAPQPLKPGQPVAIEQKIASGYCYGRLLKELVEYDYTNDGVLNEKDSDVMISRLTIQRAQDTKEKKNFDINGDGYESFEDIRLHMLCAMPYDIKVREKPLLKDVNAFVCAGKNFLEQQKKVIIESYDMTRDTRVDAYDVYSLLGMITSSRSEYSSKRSAKVIEEEKKRRAQFDINHDTIIDAKDVALLAQCSLIDY